MHRASSEQGDKTVAAEYHRSVKDKGYSGTIDWFITEKRGFVLPPAAGCHSVSQILLTPIRKGILSLMYTNYVPEGKGDRKEDKPP